MNKLIADAGQALYGPHWQSELARSLEVDRRTVSRWVAGVHGVPAGVYVDLLRLTHERAAALNDIADRIKTA